MKGALQHHTAVTIIQPPYFNSQRTVNYYTVYNDKFPHKVIYKETALIIYLKVRPQSLKSEPECIGVGKLGPGDKIKISIIVGI